MPPTVEAVRVKHAMWWASAVHLRVVSTAGPCSPAIDLRSDWVGVFHRPRPNPPRDPAVDVAPDTYSLQRQVQTQRTVDRLELFG
jgi:hypothetical protein